MNTVWWLLKKEYLLRFRTPGALIGSFGIVLLLSVLAGYGVQAAGLPPREVTEIFPITWWAIVCIVSVSAIERVSSAEHEQEAQLGLLLLGVTTRSLFLARWLSTSLYTVAISCASLVFLIVATACEASFSLSLIPIILCTSLILAALTSVTTELSYGSSSRSVLITLLTLPLTLPVLFCAVELSTLSLHNQSYLLSPWCPFALMAVCLYSLAGYFLYGASYRR